MAGTWCPALRAGKLADDDALLFAKLAISLTEL